MRPVTFLILLLLCVFARSHLTCEPTNTCIAATNTSSCTKWSSKAIVIVELDNKIEQPRYYPFCVTVDKLTQVAMNDGM